MTGVGYRLAIMVFLVPMAFHLTPSAAYGQVWIRGQTRQRAPNLIGALPPYPPRPGTLFLPRFTPQKNLLPQPIRKEVIEKDKITRERLLPNHIENRTINMDAIVKNNIFPPRFQRGIQGPPHLANDVVVPSRLNFGTTTIFSSPLVLPPSERSRNRENLMRGAMVPSHQRRELGW